jgi:hypothetical protein
MPGAAEGLNDSRRRRWDNPRAKLSPGPALVELTALSARSAASRLPRTGHNRAECAEHELPTSSNGAQ